MITLTGDARPYLRSMENLEGTAGLFAEKIFTAIGCPEARPPERRKLY